MHHLLGGFLVRGEVVRQQGERRLPRREGRVALARQQPRAPQIHQDAAAPRRVVLKKRRQLAEPVRRRRVVAFRRCQFRPRPQRGGNAPAISYAAAAPPRSPALRSSALDRARLP
ncbi:MAG: hypothetical protein R3F11_26195 [Verrucomicrobiales bacterium]